MKVITRPTVHLLAVPRFFPHPKYELPSYSSDAEALTAHAGKGCYDSYGKDGRSISNHIDSLIKSRHGSVLEHANFSVFIEGVSRGLSHELVRHRAGFAFSQRSTRYTKEEDAAMVLDPFYADMYERSSQPNGLHPVEENLLRTFLVQCGEALAAYRETIEEFERFTADEREQLGMPSDPHAFRKYCRGKARQLLPHALETRLTVTANLRAWRHFFEARTDRAAEEEIRRLAYALFIIILPWASNCFADYIAEGPIPSALSTDFRKV